MKNKSVFYLYSTIQIKYIYNISFQRIVYMNPRYIVIIVCVTLILISIIFRPSVREWYEGRIAPYEEEFQGTTDPDYARIQAIIESVENYNSQTSSISVARARASAINMAVLPDQANPTAFDNASSRLFYQEGAQKKEFVLESCDKTTKKCITSFTLEDKPDKTGVDENDLTNLLERYNNEMVEIKKMKADWDSIKGDQAKALSFETAVKGKLPSAKANDTAAYNKLIADTETAMNELIAQEASDLIQINKAIGILGNKSSMKKPVVATVSTAAATTKQPSAKGKSTAAAKPAAAPKQAKVAAAKVTAVKAAPAPKVAKQPATKKTSVRQLFKDYDKSGSNHVERFFNFMNGVRQMQEGFTSPDNTSNPMSDLPQYDLGMEGTYASYPSSESLLQMGDYVPPYMRKDNRTPLFVKPGLM